MNASNNSHNPQNYEILIQKAHLIAIEFMNKAYCPYSHFQVGAALIAESGLIIGGYNIENSSYGATVCAERTALWSALTQTSERKFWGIVILTNNETPTPPCGLCRQTLIEFCDLSLKIFLGNKHSLKQFGTLGDFLPFPFDPKQLSTSS